MTDTADFAANSAVRSDGTDLQTPFDAAVVVPTVLRPSLLRAVRSVYAQKGAGRVQVLIGVDAPLGDAVVLDVLRRERPDHVALTVVDPGYSTSARHGGVHGAYDGGALRGVLTLLANSRRVAYLDDDNHWADDHLRSLQDAITGDVWAYALRCFVNPLTNAVVCTDEWESVGPGRGVYAKAFGGFVDPNCLMVDKVACPAVAAEWTRPLYDGGQRDSADRCVFDRLRRETPGAATGRVSVFYTLPEIDADGAQRLALIRKWQAQGGVPRPRGVA
jgi:hypothetical protein